MYKKHKAFDTPEDENAKIWRYIDFTKYVSLLDKSALYFPRVDELGDPFEGSYSKVNVDQRLTLFYESENLTDKPLPPEVLSNFHKFYKRFITINCWYLNEYESAAMWKLHLKSNGGIAIQSTFKCLKDCLKDKEHDIYIGKVNYIDYEKDLLPEDNKFYRFLHKRKAFEHERELRAIIDDFPSNVEEYDPSDPLWSEGLYVPVDLDILIENIYLAPTSPKWLFDLVESVTEKYGLNKDVLQSSLDDKPVY